MGRQREDKGRKDGDQGTRQSQTQQNEGGTAQGRVGGAPALERGVEDGGLPQTLSAKPCLLLKPQTGPGAGAWISLLDLHGPLAKAVFRSPPLSFLCPSPSLAFVPC